MPVTNPPEHEKDHLQSIFPRATAAQIKTAISIKKRGGVIDESRTYTGDTIEYSETEAGQVMRFYIRSDGVIRPV